MSSSLGGFDNAILVGFYSLGLVAIIASLRVIMLANPVHAILSLIVSLLAISGIFFIAGAPFAGALQIIVYAGAILVLFVFVIMMLNMGTKNDAHESHWLKSEVWAVPTGLTVIIAIVLSALVGFGNSTEAVEGGAGMAMMGASAVSPQKVGLALFTDYLMLVEVAAMLLLAALVAAYHIGKKALDDENESHSSQWLDNTASQSDVQSQDTQKDSLHDDELSKPYVYHPVDATKFEQKNANHTEQ